MKDIKFLSISVRNFFSYGNAVTTVDLSKPGCTLISGVNLDDTSNGVGANGTGKSTILRAMLFLYANYVPDGMLIGDVVNNINNKDCMVSGVILVDGIKYTITKYRQSTEKPEKNYIEIFKGDDFEHNLVKGTSAEASKQISELIGIDPDMFRKIVMFDVNAVPFFAESGPVQRAIMEELFGLNDLMYKAEQLSERVKLTKSLIAEEEANLRTKQAILDRYNNDVAQTTNKVVSWDTIHQETVSKLMGQLQELQTVNVSELQEALKFNADIDDQVSDIVNRIKLGKSDIDALKSRLDAIKANMNSKRSTIKLLSGEIEKNQAVILKSQNNITRLYGNFCPECNQQVDAQHSATKISELDTVILTAQTLITQFEGNIVDDQAALDVLQSEFDSIADEIYQKESSLLPISREMVALNKQKKVVKSQTEIDKLKTAEVTLTATLASESSKTNPFVDILEELQSNPVEAPNYDKVNEYTAQLNHEQFLYKLMTDKKSFIRKHLIDKRLSPLNKQIHHYLQQLGLPHTAIFNNDLTVTIAKMGRPLSYGGMSGGQKARLNFALCLAFRDLLQISNQVVPFLMVDEVLDHGLDDVGVQLASNVIHTIAKEQRCSVFLITHKSEIINRFPQRITVQLKHGFSNIQNLED